MSGEECGFVESSGVGDFVVEVGEEFREFWSTDGLGDIVGKF